MAHNYCQSCSSKLMITLKMCPTCGSKKIDSQAPLSKSRVRATINPTSTATATKLNSGTSKAVNLGQALNFAPAPLGPRFLAFIIDSVTVSIMASLPILFAYLITLPFKEHSFNPLASFGVLASFVAPYIYYTVLHAAPYSATLGKKWMGIKVVNVSGELLTRMQAFLRIMVTLLLPIAGGVAVAISLGSMAMTYKDAMQDSIILAIVLALPLVVLGPYLLIFFNPLKQSLFDILMKTIVIKG
jgi:uncharacterized RDD family membrane protein YckC